MSAVSPVIAQLLIAAVQALIQMVESKLAHERRVLLVIDPDQFTDDEDWKAYERLIQCARLVRHFGPDEERKEDRP